MKKNLIRNKKKRKNKSNQDHGEVNNNKQYNSYQDYKILKKKKINKKNKNSYSQMPLFLKTENDDFNQYVKKSYRKCLNQNEVNFMTTQLEKIYLNAQSIGDFNIRNWKFTPLPILTREKMNKLSLALNSSQYLTFHSGKIPNQIPTNNFINNSHYYQTYDNNQFKNFNQNNNRYDQKLLKNNNRKVYEQNQIKNNFYEQNKFKNNNNVFDQNPLKNNPYDNNQFKNNNDNFYEHNNQIKNNSNIYGHNQINNNNNQGYNKLNNNNLPFNNNLSFNNNQLKKNNLNNKEYNNQLNSNKKNTLNYPTFIFSKNGKKDTSTPPPLIPEFDSNFFTKIKKKKNKKKNAQKKKFEKGNIKEPKRFLVPTVIENKNSTNKKKLIGKCQNLEKEYFRQTMDPKPSEIRPLHILKKSLNFILKNYHLKKKDHNYLLDQLRSIRQDLLIQDIKNDFVIEVYEKNSIFAIKYKDYLHFSKCLSNLIELYKLEFKGKNNEFYLYQLISLALKNGSSELQSFILSVPESFYYSEEFLLGKEIIESLQNDSYCFIFENMAHCKFLGLRFLLRYYKDVLRFWALDIICHTQGKNRKFEDLIRELSFENEGEFFKFLEDNKIIFEKNKDVLLLKDNREVCEELNKKVFNLF